MVDTPSIKGTLEDALRYLNITDMSGGLVTNIGALSIGANQTPDALNCFSYEGLMLARGGYQPYSTLPNNADGAYVYTDSSGTLHLMAWCEGNLYDFASGSPTLIASGVYVSGQQIGHTTLNGVMYWSTLTVPLRQYDGTTEKAVSNSGGTGTVAPPAANFLLTYTGCIVALYPVPAGVPEPSSFMWSNVNDPTSWIGANIQTVGSNDGSTVTFGLLMGVIPGGVANTGVPSTRQLLIGKTKENLFLYQGALGTLQENAIPCPVGTDCNSPVYIPTSQGLGAVCFLGSDGQLWLTNGSTAQIISQNIATLAYTLYQNALFANGAQKFNAVYNSRYQYYMVDYGNNQQLVYKWDTGAWWLFQGWPSGIYLNTMDTNGLPAILVCAGQSTVTGVYQIAVPQISDNGANPAIYYTTAYLHGGKPERQKVYDSLTLFAYNTGTQYQIEAFSMPRADGNVQTSQILTLNDPAYGTVTPTSTGMRWNVDNWNNANWAGGFPSVVAPYDLAAMRGRLNVISTPTKWAPKAEPTALKTSAAQFKISWSGGVYDFRLAGLSVAFMTRSTGFAGSVAYQTEGQQQPTAPNKFTNTGIST